MVSRRSLVEGLNDTPLVDPNVEKQFVHGRPVSSGTPPAAAKVANASSVARVPISTRMRIDLADALKRASLQRQLEKIEPNSLTEILEHAVEPWLRSNGYLD
jgi:capsular polysaccharide biosynthesis protein